MLEGAVAIAVDRGRETVAADRGTQDLEVSRAVLGVAERRGDDRPGRVVNRPDEGQPGSAPLEPVVPRAVELEEEPSLGHPLPPAPVARRPAPARGGDTRRPQDPPDRDPPEADPLALGEQLGEVAVVGPVVAALSELDHPSAGGLVQVARGSPPPVAVDEPCRPMREECPAQPPGLALRESHQQRRFADLYLAGNEAGQDVRALLVAAGHRDRLHLWRLTKSLIS